MDYTYYWEAKCCYQVVYVHLVGRLVKRLMAKGMMFHTLRNVDSSRNPTLIQPPDFEVALAPIDVAEVKVAIVRDPNGLDVRLMELTDSQLNETSNRKQVSYEPIVTPPSKNNNLTTLSTVVRPPRLLHPPNSPNRRYHPLLRNHLLPPPR